MDLRSDTLTRPTPAMRKAMAEAEVGDDAYGEDPTVNRLEALAAERLGFERALFLPSGTMANQVALRTLTRPGDEVVMVPAINFYKLWVAVFVQLCHRVVSLAVLEATSSSL